MDTQKQSPDNSSNQELKGGSTQQQATQQSTAAETHFGYSTVREDEKAGRVAEVFHSVAAKYDIMNDLMSGGHTVFGKIYYR